MLIRKPFPRLTGSVAGQRSLKWGTHRNGAHHPAQTGALGRRHFCPSAPDPLFCPQQGSKHLWDIYLQRDTIGRLRGLRPVHQLQLFQPQSSDKPQIFSPKCPQTKPSRKF